LEFEGTVSELLPNATFRVLLDNNNHEIIATRRQDAKNRIRFSLAPVMSEMSPTTYKGRINYRSSNARMAGQPSSLCWPALRRGV